MWGALVSGDKKVYMFRRKDGISITFEHGQLTDEQAEDLFFVVEFLYRSGKRLKDIWKEGKPECNPFGEPIKS